MKITIYFDGQFWIGIVEMTENNKLKVCKHTFGSEPKDSEILDFIFHDMIPLLNSTSGVKNSIDKSKNKTINPKRLIRLAAKEMKNQGVSNKSYEALRIELEQKKKMKKCISRQMKEELKEQKRQLKIQKRKAKHRGK
ncbi:YjdF family protein [Bacillus paramycoides]|uniref:YjdF family protein n=1 Tax=Bacillus paramycoides TaxID=2026194 RepID=UPI003D00FD03